MSQAKVKATKLKAARVNHKSQSSHKLSQQQVIVDHESHNFRLSDTTSNQGSTILTVFHIKESKFDIEKRISTSRLAYQYNPYKRFADTSLYRQVLPIPLRPGWNNYSTREQLQQNEVEKFDQYLKVIYDSIPPSRLTHFEHNLDVWRQLWRVCEISDVLCACVDARHPLFHFPPALYDFIVKKLKKPLIVILNKIDLVPRTIIIAWESFLKKIYPDVHIIKFSSHPNPTDGALNNNSNQTNHSSFLTDDSVRLTKGMSVHSQSGGKQTGAGVAHKYQPLGSALLKTFWNILSHIVDHSEQLPSNVPKLEHNGSIVTNELVSFALEYSRRIGANDDIVQNDVNTPIQPQHIYDLGDVFIPDSVLITDQMEIDEKLRRTTKANLHRRVNELNNNTNGTAGSDDDDDDDISLKTAEVQEQLRLLQLASRDDSSDDDNNNNHVHTTMAKTKTAQNTNNSHNNHNNIDSDDEFDMIDTIGNAQSALQYKQQQKISLTIGMVGHPNAGKSSLINAILGRPAVSVSNTPGHTKHLQTLTTIPHCSKSIRLCDSPGIVFPAVDISRSLQTLLGIFPHPKLAEPYTCVQFLAERLPLVNIYQLKPHMGVDADAVLHGSSHPGGDKAQFVEGYQDIILKTKYDGKPTDEERNKKLFSIPSNASTNTHPVFIDGTITSMTTNMAMLINHNTNGNGQENQTNTTANTTTSPQQDIPAPILVNGIDIASLAPTSKANNKKKGGKGNDKQSNSNKSNPKEPQQLASNKQKTPNALFDTLDQLLVDDRFDQYTNPRFVWSSYRICESYAVKRGWFTESSGKPDTFKAGMSIVKDCVDGKLNLFFLPPRTAATQQQ